MGVAFWATRNSDESTQPVAWASRQHSIFLGGGGADGPEAHPARCNLHNIMNTLANILLLALPAPLLSACVVSQSEFHPTPIQAEKAAQPAADRHVRAFLLHEHGVLKAGETTTLALHFVIDAEWHMYWNGYAEDGMEPKWELQLPVGIEVAGDVVWPIPHRLQASEFVVEHAYEGHLTLLIPVRVAEDVKQGDVQVSVKAKWLVCSDRCVPESGEDVITLRVDSETLAKTSMIQPATATKEAQPGEAGRPSQSAAKKIIEDARADLARLLPLSGPRAKELGIAASIVQNAGAATLQLRATGKVTSLTWFPANDCATPTSDFGDWTTKGASLDIPLKTEATAKPGDASDSRGSGESPETGQNPANSVCVRGILQVKTSDGTHNASEYFVIHVKADAGK